MRYRGLRMVLGFLLSAILSFVPPVLALEVGQPAPQLTVQEFDGSSFNLAAERGKVVIVNFWATWCPPCRAELPALKAVYDRYHSKGLELIALSLDRSHDRNEAVRMMSEYGLPGAMRDDASADGFGQPGTLPVTVIIGPRGKVRAIHTPDQPELTETSLSAVVAPLLARRSSPSAHPTGTVD